MFLNEVILINLSGFPIVAGNDINKETKNFGVSFG